jgi:predicted phage terminase large subunit-like protein
MMTNFGLLLRNDVLTFANRAHIELHRSPLDDDSYLRLLAFDIERIVAGNFGRYLCNMPPGSGKTFLLSVTLAAWLLGHNPSTRILIASYGEVPALMISKKIRDLIEASFFLRAFPNTILSKAQRAAGDFATTAGGAVYARSVDGATTGLRCDCLICDDLVQIRDSGNLQHLGSVNESYDTELVSRLNPPGTIVIVQHRLNKSDLTGHVLKRQGWKHRVLPLVAPEDRNYRLKNGVWRRKEGEVLRPNAYSPEHIAELQEYTGAPGYGPLYQQTFEGPDVVQVRREDFVVETFYGRPTVPFILSIDPNFKGENGQSFGVIQCWGVLDDGRFLLFDQWRGRVHKSIFADHIRAMRANYRAQMMLIEENGPAFDLQAYFDSSSCPVILVQPTTDKLSRLRRNLDLFRNHRVVLRAGSFNEDLIAEFEQFPYGAHDDQVDAATQFFDCIRSGDLPAISFPPPARAMGAHGSTRRAQTQLYWNAGRPSGPYVFSRR